MLELRQIVGQVENCTGCVMLATDDVNHLAVSFDSGSNEQKREFLRFYIGPDPDQAREKRGIPGHVFVSGIALVVDDVLQEERFLQNPSPGDATVSYRSLLCVPVLGSGRVLGVLCLQDPGIKAFDRTVDILIAQIAATVVARLLPGDPIER
jgi:GAF domain-containing protein